MISDTPACVRAHLGFYAILPVWLHGALHAIQHDLWRPSPMTAETMRGWTENSVQHDFLAFYALNTQAIRKPESLYTQIDDIALIRLVDALTKGSSKFGGTSTVFARRALRQAAEAEDIKRILLAIDSPGGMVAGTMELADEVARTAIRKPVMAHIEDMGASAAYWVGSQAQRITATRLSQIGSIGVFAEIIDSSGAAARAGLTIHVRSTGPYKGMGIPGTPVPPLFLDEIDALVAGLGREFFTAVRRGRHMSEAQLAAVTTGQVWLAPEAKALGLVDGIESFEEALHTIRGLRLPQATHRSQRTSAYARRIWKELYG